MSTRRGPEIYDTGARYTGRDTPRESERTKARPICECGNRVSSDFQRVLCGNNGEVHACPECATAAAIFRGAAANPDYEHRIDHNRGGGQ